MEVLNSNRPKRLIPLNQNGDASSPTELHGDSGPKRLIPIEDFQTSTTEVSEAQDRPKRLIPLSAPDAPEQPIRRSLPSVAEIAQMDGGTQPTRELAPASSTAAPPVATPDSLDIAPEEQSVEHGPVMDFVRQLGKAIGQSPGNILRGLAEMSRSAAPPSPLAMNPAAFIGRPEAAEAAEEAISTPPAPIEEDPFHRAGTSITESVEEAIPGSPEGVAGKLGAGIGSTAAFLASAPLGPGGPLLAGMSMSADELASQAREAGADEETVQQAAAWGSLIGTTEVLPIGSLFHKISKLDKATGGLVRKGIKNMLVQAGEEGTQEVVQQLSQNAAAIGLFDPERPLEEGVAEAGGVGAVVGALFAGVGSVASGANQARSERLQQRRDLRSTDQPNQTNADRGSIGRNASPPSPSPEISDVAELVDATSPASATLPPEPTLPPTTETGPDRTVSPPGREELERAPDRPSSTDAGPSAILETDPGTDQATTPSTAELTPELTETNGALRIRLRDASGSLAGMLRATPDLERGALTLESSVVPPELRGQGNGTRLYEEAAREAHRRGLTLESDTFVSTDAARVYEGLREKGYQVERNPNVIEHRKGLMAQPGTGPVYRITAKQEAPTLPVVSVNVSVGESGRVDEGENQFSDEGQYLDAVAEASADPAEIASAYQQARETARVPSPKEAAIAEHLRGQRVSMRSYDRFGDPARRRDDTQITRQYLAGDGQDIDQAAQEMSTVAGEAVTPADVVDFIDRHPGGPSQFEQSLEPEVARRLAARYKEVTGGRLTDRRLQDLTQPSRAERTPVAELAPFAPERELGSPTRTLEAPQERRGKAPASTRTPVAPLPGGQAKPLNQILLDFQEASGQRVRRAKTRAGAGGTYFPGSARTVIRFEGDLDTAAHEMAHALDDRYGIVAEWAEEETSPFDRELIPHFSQHGSAATSGPRSAKPYVRAEGVAEWVRAYIVNPEAAEAAAPQFAAHFKEQVPDDVLSAIEQFSTDVRQWAGSSPEARTLSNVETELSPETLTERVKDLFRTNELGIGFFTRFVDAPWFDSMAPVWKAVAYARRLQGIEQVLPHQDTRTLVRLVAGMDRRVDDVFERGPLTATLERATDERGQAIGGFHTLFEPLDTSSQSAIEQDMQGVVALMVNQRVLEKAEQLEQLAMQIEQGARDEAMIQEELQGAQEAEQKLRDELGALRHQRNTGGRIERGAIGRVQSALRATREEVQALQVSLRGVRREIRDARKRLGYKGKPDGATAFARHRAERLAGTGGGIYSDRTQAAEALEEARQDPERYARLQEAARRYRAWADAVLEYYRDKGRITPETYEQIRSQNRQYVAMQRLIEDISPEMKRASRALASKSEVIQRFKGSTRRIANPYVSLMQQTHALIREADRNEALRTFRDLLTTDRSIYDGEVLDLDAVGSRAKQGDESTITIFVDGKPEYWQFQEDVHGALKGLGQEVDRSVAAKAAALLPRLAHDFITHSPAFLVRNVARDPVQRGVITRTDSKTFGHLVYALPGGKKQFDKDLSDFYRYGGGLFGHYRGDRSGYYQRLDDAIELVVGREDTILSTFARAVQGYKNLASSSEAAGRVVEFRSAYRKAKEELGYDDYDAGLYAALEARDITDYAVAGTAARELNRYLIFFNAAIQGTLRTFRGIQEAPLRFAARWLFRVGAMELFTYLWNVIQGDEEEYRQLPAYQRDLFWNYKLGPDMWLRIPKPWELGVLASGISRGIDAARGKAHAFEGWAGSMLNALTPLDEQALLGPFRTLAEAMMNKDLFRDRYIVSPWEDGLDLERREGTQRASRLGQLLQQPLQVDARKMDHVIEGQFGGVGRMATAASDLGRDDRQASQQLGFETAGVFSRSPVYSARDVQWVLDWAERTGNKRHKRVQQLSDRLGKYFETKDAAARDALGQRIRDYATRQREIIENAGGE